MKFGIITKKRMELIELNKKLHQLDKEFQKEIKNLEKDGIKVDDGIKNSLNNLLHSIESIDSLNTIDENKYYIFNTIPKEGLYKKKLYCSLINTISIKLNDKDNEVVFNNEDNYSIFDCLYQIDDISKKYIDNIGNNVNILIYLIRLNKNNLKVSTALNLLHDIGEIKPKELENDLVEILRDTTNNKKIEELYNLINANLNNASKIQYEIYNDILKYIKIYKNNENYDKYLNDLINIFIKNSLVNDSEGSIVINYVLETLLNNYKNKNIELAIELLDKVTITKENREMIFLAIDNIVSMNFINEEHKKLYLKVLKDIFNSDIDDKVIKYLVEKVNDINSTKTLQLLIDIYPLIIKYSYTSEEYVVNELINFDKLENMPCKGKKKELILPINYEEEK